MNRVTKEEIIKKKLRTVYIAPYYYDSYLSDPLNSCSVFLSRKAARKRVRETFGDVCDADDYIRDLRID